MSDDIYDEKLSYSAGVLVPKLSDNNVKGTSGHKNAYIKHKEVKSSRSNSKIIFINAAMHVEKLDLSAPALQSHSQGDGKHQQNVSSNCSIPPASDDKLLASRSTFAKIPGSCITVDKPNEAGDRLPSPLGWCPHSNKERSKNLCGQFQNNDLETSPVSSRDSDISGSFLSTDENSSRAANLDDSRRDFKIIQTPLEQQGHSSLSDELTDPAKSSPGLLYQSHSNIDWEAALPVESLKTTNQLIRTYSDESVPRRYSTKLSDANFISSFPEKSIRNKIVNAQVEKGDFSLPENWESLIPYEDLPWFRWYTKKLEQERILEARQREEEEKKNHQNLNKKKIEEENLSAWRERKAKEAAVKQREEMRKQDLQRKQKELEKVRAEELAEKTRKEWNKKKAMEKKAQKHKDDQLKRQREEEQRLRSEKNKQAFDAWSQRAKNTPKPMSIAIKDLKGRSDPTLARLKWNPTPWRDIVDQPKTNRPKEQGKKKQKLIKPSST